MKYDKPTRVLVRDMLASWQIKPGQVFTNKRAVDWFAEHYPLLRHTNVRAHLVQAATNNKNRLHYSGVTTSDDVLFQVGPGQFRLYEQGKDPAPIHEMVAGDVEAQEVAGVTDDADLDDEDREHSDGGIDSRAPSASSTEFLLERDLQMFLVKHLERIEPGLRLYEDEGIRGVEFDAGGGRRIDILATDSVGGLVVIELKVSKGYDRVVGQLLRYVTWVKVNVAERGQRVRGIIICRTMSEDLRLACAGIPDVELYEYQMSVTVSQVEAASLI